MIEKVYRANNDGIRSISRIKDVLIHVITEEIHHGGEMIVIIWQMNIQPPDIDTFADRKTLKLSNSY